MTQDQTRSKNKGRSCLSTTSCGQARQTPLRVDKFIINLVAHLSRNKLQTAAKSGYVRVNGEPVKSNHKVKPGDVVTVELPQRF